MNSSPTKNTIEFYGECLQTTRQAGELVTSLTNKLKSNDEVILELNDIKTVTENYTDRVLWDFLFKNAKDIEQWHDKKITLNSDKAVYDLFKKGIQSLIEYSEHRQDKEILQNKILIVRNMLHHNKAA